MRRDARRAALAGARPHIVLQLSPLDPCQTLTASAGTSDTDVIPRVGTVLPRHILGTVDAMDVELRA